MGIGFRPDKSVLVKDLSEVVHLLIGGTTGAGKTIFIYSIIQSLLKTHPDPEDLELILSSPKYEDFSFFENLPHLNTRKIITDANDATPGDLGLCLEACGYAPPVCAGWCVDGVARSDPWCCVFPERRTHGGGQFRHGQGHAAE